MWPCVSMACLVGLFGWNLSLFQNIIIAMFAVSVKTIKNKIPLSWLKNSTTWKGSALKLINYKLIKKKLLLTILSFCVSLLNIVAGIKL